MGEEVYNRKGRGRVLKTMALWLAVVLLVVALAEGSTVHHDPDDPVVLHFLRTLNRVGLELSQSSRDSVAMGPLRLGNVFASASLSDGFFGNLSSFVVDDQTILEEDSSSGTSFPHTKVFRYKMWVHMGDLEFHYKYVIRLLGLVMSRGTLRVTPVQNLATVIGSVNLTSTSSCEAALEDATVKGVDTLRIEFDQETWFHTIIKYSFDIIVNFVYKSLKSPIQDMVESFLHVDVFKKEFSQIFCKAFMEQ